MTGVPEALEVADSMPQAAPLQPAPESVQVTPLFCGSFCTVAVKLWVCPVCRDEFVGDTLTPTGGGGAVTVIVAEELLLPSATDVAVRLTVAGFGTLPGGV